MPGRRVPFVFIVQAGCCFNAVERADSISAAKHNVHRTQKCKIFQLSRNFRETVELIRLT